MRRRPLGPFLIVILAVILLVMPAWQFKDWLKTRQDKDQATLLLYQVTSFQMELLGSSLNEASRITTAETLNEWKRSAYSALYAHERLSLAAGHGLPSKLESLDVLLQWIQRVQVSGERPLSKEEAELVQGIAKSYKPLMEAYGGLVDRDGGLNSSSANKLKKADSELAELVRKKLK
jgi:hypothetical protein